MSDTLFYGMGEFPELDGSSGSFSNAMLLAASLRRGSVHGIAERRFGRRWAAAAVVRFWVYLD